VSRSKTERLLNLVICLLAARRFLSREEIRRAVPGYPDAGEAFERAFERDKDELREMGVPVETGSNSALFEDEVGYRIRRDAYALPEISFTAEELSVLALAAQAWQSGALAGAASRALLKLQAHEHSTVDRAAATSIPGLDPRVEGNEAAFAPLWQALAQRRPVRFSYRRRGGEGPELRTVEPWGLVARQGRWYLVGHDRDRGERRVFRLSRIAGEVSEIGRPQEVVVPEGINLSAEVAAFAPPTPQGTARVAVRPGAGGFLRRRGTVDGSVPAPSGASGPPTWDVLSIPFAEAEQVAGDVAGLGAHAYVLEPAEVREAVRHRLQRVAQRSAPAGVGAAS
jgi:proteasome accessory factor B